VKVFSGTGRLLTEFLATSASDRNGVSVGVVADREGQPRIATLVGNGRGKQVRLFDPRSSGTPAPLGSFQAVGVGAVATPSDRSDVKRFDATSPTPRVLQHAFPPPRRRGFRQWVLGVPGSLRGRGGALRRG
jgi:hypothetical protein